MQRVTVVIPVFNQPALAAACIASCLKHIHPRHSLLVLDDASTDPATYPALEKALAGAPNARLVRNTQNLGFLKTCNRAVLELDGTENDILLLNSDAVVTEGFLEEMLACLYASERHGVCNPRTDAAASCTIVPVCSVELEPQQRFEAWQRLKDMLPRYHVMPSGVGFCLLIRRSLIRKFGLFDEAYSPGYHEETDFCMRIGRYGFSSILANRAFVFHKGHASFGAADSNALDAQHALLLAERYPESAQFAEAYRSAFLPVADHFGEALGTAHPRRSVLYDLSHLPAVFNGTSEYALNLLAALHPILSEDLDVHILISKAADAFFSVSKRYPDVHLHAEDVIRRYDLAFVPQQIYTTAHLSMLNTLAVRIVSNMQDLIALRSPSLSTPELRFAVELSIRHVDGLMSVSQASLDDLAAFEQRRSVPGTVVHHGITPPAAPLSAQADGEPFVFIVGNDFHHKAVALAAAHLPAGMHSVTLGGRGTDMSANGTIPQETVDGLYRTCAVVLFPSQYEGFGLPLLHAAARGKRIVAWNSQPLREIMEAFGLQEHVMTFEDFSEIPACIERALSLPAPPPLPPSKRTWRDAAEETAAFLRAVLEKPTDIPRLQDRFIVLRLLDFKQRESDQQHFTAEYYKISAEYHERASGYHQRAVEHYRAVLARSFFQRFAALFSRLRKSQATNDPSSR